MISPSVEEGNCMNHRVELRSRKVSIVGRFRIEEVPIRVLDTRTGPLFSYP